MIRACIPHNFAAVFYRLVLGFLVCLLLALQGRGAAALELEPEDSLLIVFDTDRVLASPANQRLLKRLVTLCIWWRTVVRLRTLLVLSGLSGL